MQRKTSSGGQGGLRLRARAARASPAPGGQGELRPCARPARATLAPCGQGGSGRAPERRTSPRPPDTLLGIYIT